MGPERWARIKELFEKALAVPPDSRRSVLAQAAGSDHDLAVEVESLLDAFSEDFLAQPFEWNQDGGETESTPTVDDIVGETIGDYEVLEKLATGGMGDIYKARKGAAGALVILKRLSGRALEDPEGQRRFQREARAAMALQHPNIVSVDEILEWESDVLLRMKLVEGLTLRDTIAKRALPLVEALDYAIQVADALVAAHELGIVHRDVKPSNVLITPDRKAMLFDFGLAKIIQPENLHEALTMSNTAISRDAYVFGSAGYMSPEQVKGHAVDARADIFGFGALVYETLTGTRAFTGATALDAVTSILFDEPEPMRAKLPSIPAELEEVVLRSLRKEPSERFATMGEMRERIVAIKQKWDARSGESQPRRGRWWRFGS